MKTNQQDYKIAQGTGSYTEVPTRQEEHVHNTSIICGAQGTL